MTFRTFRDAYLLVQDVPSQYPHHHSHSHPHLQTFRHTQSSHAQSSQQLQSTHTQTNQQLHQLPSEQSSACHQPQQSRQSSKTSFGSSLPYSSSVRPYPLYSSFAQPYPSRQHHTDNLKEEVHLPPHDVPCNRSSLPLPPQPRISRQYEHPLLPQSFPRSPYRQVTVTPAFIGTMTKAVFVKVCSAYLDAKSDANTKFVSLPSHTHPESVFFSVSKPDISTEEYVLRLVSYTQCSPSAFIVMLVYLDRVAAVNGRLNVTCYNLHRLLITALMLACKMVDDHCFSTVHYAKVGGIPTAREMNRLEIQFLHFVNYRLHVAVDEYFTKQHDLESRVLGIA